MQPPVAKKQPKTDTIHGETLIDNYFWLREKEKPEVAAYLEAENAYTDSVMGGTAGLQEKLYQEMLGRIKQTDLSVPQKDGEYWYYSRTEEGKQYPIHCRKKGTLDAPEQVTLDLNELGKGLKYISLGEYEVSDDGNLLAFNLDKTGFRQYTLQVKDLRTGEIFPESIEKTSSIVWAADNKTLFYAVEDEAKRPYRLYRHTLGSDPKNDTLVFEEKDERFNLGADRTRSKAFLLMVSGSHTTTEWRVLSADRPTGEWKLVEPRTQDHEYYLSHRGDLFYIRSNAAGRNFSLLTAPASDPSRANWKEIRPHRDTVMIEDLDLFENFLVLSEREGGLPQIHITDLRSNTSHRISFPEPTYTAGVGNNPEFHTEKLRYSYQSLVTPNSVYDYDMSKKSAELKKRTEVLGGYDPANYRSERIFAAAGDGTKVPISLVYRKGMKQDGTTPLFLNGYGSYGYPYPIVFSSTAVSLLDRGIIVAYAHIRGGGEMGKKWHDDGRMMMKKNTFSDFIAVAEHLIAQKYTAKDRLIIQGGSAGGLLMGAVTNMRPDLFKAAIFQVPFVDVINTMLDESLPLTVGEFEEWGNPKVKPEYEYMKSYCPYTNLAAKAYPATLVKTSFNDSQVMYWEPAKFVAKSRTLRTDKNPLLLKTNMGAGHGGSSGRYDRLREIAFDYAFVLNQLRLAN